MKLIRKSGIDFEQMFAYGYREEFKRKCLKLENLDNGEVLKEDPDFSDRIEDMENDIDSDTNKEKIS